MYDSSQPLAGRVGLFLPFHPPHVAAIADGCRVQQAVAKSAAEPVRGAHGQEICVHDIDFRPPLCAVGGKIRGVGGTLHRCHLGEEPRAKRLGDL